MRQFSAAGEAAVGHFNLLELWELHVIREVQVTEVSIT
jgi:hypothetical protein